MPWSEADRAKYEVIRARYSSDMSEAELALIAPLLPPPKRRGRKPTDSQIILNALFYLIRCGCPWRYLPKDFPPFTTVQNRFYAWRDSGLWAQIISVLVMDAREAEGRQAAPTAVVVDSQSVKTTEAGGLRGFDAGKKIKGRKRHILTDTGGLLVGLVIHQADIQDRDGAPLVLASIKSAFPWLRHIFADGAYAGEKLAQALAPLGDWALEIVKRSDAAKGFVLLPRRWVVERTFAWLNRNRRLAKDFEELVASASAWIMIASVKMIMRRLARG